MNTFERCLIGLAAIAALIAPVCGQTAERRADFSGAGGSDAGKCRIEVYVDGSVDVEIRGDRGYLRTLSGQPAEWRRFICSGPMPANPSELRFAAIDGRGRQQLIQEPGRSRGSAVVTIQDRDGGSDAYTFDLLWRGGTFSPGPRGQQPWGGMDRTAWPNEAAGACQDAVREEATRQHGLRNIEFRNMNADNNQGRNDTITGSFDVRRGSDRDTYRYSCAMNLANRRVQRVDISQGWGAGTADRYARGYDATSACQNAVGQKIERDGYRNVQFGRVGADYSKHDKIAGTASAQRGNNGRAYDFNIGCTVDLDNGNIKSIQVSRR